MQPQHGNRVHRTGDTVAVNVAGQGIAWNGGVFDGPADMVHTARFAAHIGALVTLGGATFAADDTTPLGALAAMCVSRPGRTVIVDAPDSVHDYLDANGFPHQFSS